MNSKTNFEIVKLLVKKEINVNAKDSRKHTALHYAKKYKDAKLIKYLIRSGAK